MRRLSVFILSGFLCSCVAFAGGKGRIGTAAGGDPTDIGSNDGTFSFEPGSLGGGVFDYHNIGPDPITDITLRLTATADAGEFPFSFSTQSLVPTEGEKFVLELTALQQPPLPNGKPLIDWTFYSYIFSQITLTGNATGIDCSNAVNPSDACLTITFSGGSIPVGGFFGFDLNDNYTADICTPNSDDGPCTVGTFLPDAATNPPAGGFAGVLASGSVDGPGLVPEPATLGMLGIAGVGLALFRLRRRPTIK